MAINLNKIKLINFKILVKSKFCVRTSSKTLEFSNYLSWTNIYISQQVQNWNYFTSAREKIPSTS